MMTSTGKKNGKCTFPSIVTLQKDLQCNGEVECNADILRAVKIEDGDVWGFYTYVATTRFVLFW